MVVCAGQALVDCIVKGGTASVADSIGIYPGGEAVNEAVTLSRLGTKVILSAAIGADHAGDIIRKTVVPEGIGTMPGAYPGATPVSLLTVNPDGSRSSRLSQAHFLPGYLPELPDCSLSFVTMASLFRAPFLSPAACKSFASAAKQKGAKIIADTKLPKGTDPKLDDYDDFLPLVDYITPNRQEAEYFTREKDPVTQAEIFRSKGVKNVIIKLDSDGAYILPEEGEGFIIPAYKVKVADGVGAGDAFIGGLIHALLMDGSLREAARFATACAAVSVTAPGALTAIKNEKQILNFIKKHN